MNQFYVMRTLPQDLVQILQGKRPQWVHRPLTKEDRARRQQCQDMFDRRKQERVAAV